MKSGIIFSFLLIIISVGCRSTKEISKVIQPKDSVAIFTNHSVEDSIARATEIITAYKNNKIDFTTFSARIKADVENKKGKQPDLSAIVRIYKDSAIWISVSATFLNYEVYRIFITPDSIILLNKQDKEVQFRSMDFLQEVTEIPFDFETLQQMLVGNAVFFDENSVTIKSEEQYILMSHVGEYFKHLLTLDATSKVLLHSKLDDVDVLRNRTATMSYSEYENINDKPFPTYRHIMIAEKNKIELKLKYKQIEFNKELSVSFNIPKNYTRK